MTQFLPKKRWGQHFLHDKNIAKKIANSLSCSPHTLLEIGPGTGALTQMLVERYPGLTLIEIDTDLAEYLQKIYTPQQAKVIVGDFLQLPLDQVTQTPLTIIGNFPYNISSQIFFKVLDHRQQVQEVVAMIQQEVAERIAAQPGSKTYGILSVLLQAFYQCDYLFKVPPQVFSPPPQVQSAVIRLKRNQVQHLGCDERLFFRIVKAGFQQRRKTLRNALKPFLPATLDVSAPIMGQRAEQLDVKAFVQLTQTMTAEGAA